jgi:hypothetical protein
MSCYSEKGRDCAGRKGARQGAGRISNPRAVASTNGSSRFDTLVRSLSSPATRAPLALRCGIRTVREDGTYAPEQVLEVRKDIKKEGTEGGEELCSRTWQGQFFPPRLMVQPNFNLATVFLVCPPDGETCSNIPQYSTARSHSICTYSQEGLDFHNRHIAPLP